MIGSGSKNESNYSTMRLAVVRHLHVLAQANAGADTFRFDTAIEQPRTMASVRARRRFLSGGGHGNLYEDAPALAGQRVELVFDPFDLATVEVHYAGRTPGEAVPRRIGRDTHTHARPDEAALTAGQSGIDHLCIVGACHDEVASRHISYTSFTESTDPADNFG
jgi:hypothetical protein